MGWLWEGIITPLVTPFTRSGDVDEEGYARNMEFQIKSGVHGLVCLATAGEAPSLRFSEKVRVIDLATAIARGRVPLLVGIGGINLHETTDLLDHAANRGANGVFVITPYFFKYTRDEMLSYFVSLAQSSSLPMMVYNSTYAGTPLDPDAIERLSAVERFVALKEGNQAQASEVIRRVGTRIAVFSSRDTHAFEVLVTGGAGAVAYCANVVPQSVTELFRLVREGRWVDALTIQRRLNPLALALVARSYPAPLKAAMNLAGLSGGFVRGPLTDLSDEEVAPVRQALVNLGVV